MSRILLGSLLSLALFTGCTAAHADRVAPAHRPLVPIAVAPDAVRAPYSVQIIAEDGSDLDTFFHRGRYYVHGAAGVRYTVRVTNPTPQRVEAVISIDGTDVIDGEPGDLRKRGYVVQPYGTLDIEGWRTSLDNVSSFRFSAIGDSYAARKGRARNVGVIAVALFAEQAGPEIILDGPYHSHPGYDDGDEGHVDHFHHRGAAATGTTAAPPATNAGPAPRDLRADAAKASADAPSRPAPRPAGPPPPARTTAQAESAGADFEAPTARVGGTGVGGGRSVDAAPGRWREEEARRPAERLGLGTEFGETRHSAANYTRFVRSSERPIAVAELRYNDTAGLRALGIILDPTPDAHELDLRETADPFPGDRGFARPPAGIR